GEGSGHDQVGKEEGVRGPAGEQPIEEGRGFVEVSEFGTQGEPGARERQLGGVESRVEESEPAGSEREERDAVDPAPEGRADVGPRFDRRDLGCRTRAGGGGEGADRSESALAGTEGGS